MPRKAYLTIDDSPSERTDDLVAFLAANGAPALLFCRGDRMEEDPGPVVRAIRAGMVVGNHTYRHRRASAISFEEEAEEIDRTDALIEKAYALAGTKRPGKYFRFSYMDRGMGARFTETDAPDPAHRDAIENLMRTGLGGTPQPPDPALIEKKRRIQDHLAKTGHTPVPFENVTVPWYAQTEMSRSIDALCTFSTCDWMLTKRHLEKDWPYRTADDLKRRIDTDPWLADERSAHIVLAHDQAEIFEPVCGLILHFLARGYSFILPGPRPDPLPETPG